MVGTNDPDFFYHPFGLRPIHDYIYHLESAAHRWRTKHVFAHRHIHFLDLGARHLAPSLPRPIRYIQVVREPLSLLISFFYYDTYHRGRSSYLALNRASRVITGKWVNFSKFLAGDVPFIEFHRCVEAYDRTRSPALPVW